MNAEASGSRGRPSQSRGHRHNRGRGGGRGGGGGGGHARGRGGGNNGGYHRGSSRGASRIASTMNDPSLDPQLAPRPPHPGYFHPSFLENPWYQLEAKLGIPHLNPVVPHQPQQEQRDPAENDPHELVSPQAAAAAALPQAHDDTT